MKRVLECRASVVVGVLALLSDGAAAHSGIHHASGNGSFIAGFLHPILAADHLLAIFAIGFWGAYFSGRAVVAVPLVFVSMMVLGATLGARGVPLPAVENTIAVSIFVFGMLISMLARLQAGQAAAIVGLFAIFHGCAHGAEMPEFAQPLVYGAGFVLASITLLGMGVFIGRYCNRSVPPPIVRVAGAALALFGVVTVAWA